MANILVLTPRFPFPPLSGDKVRIYHISRILSSRHNVTLLSLSGGNSEPEEDPPNGIFNKIYKIPLSKWRAWGRCALAIFKSIPLQLAYYQSRRFREAVRQLVPEHDLVLAHLIRTGQYVEDARLPRVLEMTDALSMTYDRVRAQTERRGVMQCVYSLEAGRVKQIESRMAHHFDLTTVVSSVDKKYLQQQIGGDPRIEVYSNGVDLETFTNVAAGDQPVAVFVGNMRTEQNQDACRHFIDNIIPYIREKIPDFRFRIVGSSPPGVAEKFNDECVDFVGEVDRIPEAVEGAFCAVCPMRIGAGVQNKVLEYMAMGLPTVVSSVGLEGLDAEPGTEILTGSSPEDFGGKVIELYKNAAMRKRLGERGREYVQNHHQWEHVLEPFVRSVESLLNDRRGRSSRDE